MRHPTTITMVMSAALALSGAASAQQSFGELAYPGPGGTSIPFEWSQGDNDNTNFLYTNTAVNSSWLTVGLRASPYYSGLNGVPQYVGNNTFEVEAGTTLPDVGGGNPNFDPNGPRWGFNWSISMDGNRSAEALNGLWWSMRISGPNSTGGTGNWGTQLFGMVDLGEGPVLGTDYSQGRWQMGYEFFPWSSQNTPGVATPGLWEGLAFNPNTLGDYQFTIDVRQGQYGSVLGSTTMTVSVVPAPGVLALLGVAGFIGGRRRH
jgi:MYXO-CTERM domain-containing protein